MLVKDIVKNVNKILANSSSFKLTYNQLELYINSSIDHINFVLKTESMNPKEQWEHDFKQNYIDSLKQAYLVFDYEDLLDKLIQAEEIELSDEAEYLYTHKPKLFYKTIGYDLFESYINEQLEGETPDITLDNFNYTALPDSIIRTVLIYHIAASYLEEEDEFETQYKTYMNRAEDALLDIQHTYYSVYKTNIFDLDKETPKPKQNPYWIDGDD